MTVQGKFTLDNYARILSRALSYLAILRSVWIGGLVSSVCLVFGYSLAFIIARTVRPSTVTILTPFSCWSRCSSTW